MDKRCRLLCIPLNTKYEEPDIIAGLLALYRICGASNAHYPMEYIRKKFREPYRQFSKSIIKKMYKRGFVSVKKGKNKAYGITKFGVERLGELGLL
jgi:hypothetical protein